MNRDKIVIALILFLAIVLATYAWWFRFDQGDAAASFWGGRSANLIRNAPQVELLVLRPSTNADEAGSDEPIQSSGQAYTVVERFDISKAPGMLNARQAFIEDASFNWNVGPSPAAHWQYALVFSSAGAHAHVLLDLSQNLVGLLESNAITSIEPMSAGLRKFIAEKIERHKRS